MTAAIDLSLSRRQKRLVLLAAALLALGGAVALVLSAFQKNLVFFYSPAQVAAGEAPKERSFRLGGLVEQGSVRRDADGLSVNFTVTDLNRTIRVRYKGILPDLFREGKGVVAQGRLHGADLFVADEVLAKHDENYMPPEAAKALAAGSREKWKERGGDAAVRLGGQP